MHRRKDEPVLIHLIPEAKHDPVVRSFVILDCLFYVLASVWEVKFCQFKNSYGDNGLYSCVHIFDSFLEMRFEKWLSNFVRRNEEIFDFEFLWFLLIFLRKVESRGRNGIGTRSRFPVLFPGFFEDAGMKPGSGILGFPGPGPSRSSFRTRFPVPVFSKFRPLVERKRGF
uniref:Uncharacterized protein n=1 Tax=Meloidogyne enterolobii TaxID=390850 RepID=A0A6V7UB06_MELEN|nr:unnamed protein product [Meloidogyne enterolobii]